jgi:hypothetical protein
VLYDVLGLRKTQVIHVVTCSKGVAVADCLPSFGAGLRLATCYAAIGILIEYGLGSLH